MIVATRSSMRKDGFGLIRGRLDVSREALIKRRTRQGKTKSKKISCIENQKVNKSRAHRNKLSRGFCHLNASFMTHESCGNRMEIFKCRLAKYKTSISYFPLYISLFLFLRILSTICMKRSSDFEYTNTALKTTTMQ